MVGKNTYFALRKSTVGSVMAENRFGSVLDGTVDFSVDAMIRPIELEVDKSVLKIDGIVDFGIHKKGIYIKIPGCPIIYSNDKQGMLRENEWCHIGMTTNGSTVSLYIEGVFNCSVFVNTSLRTNENTNAIIGEGFAGDIRYVRIFNDYLDGDTMKEIMYEPNISQIPLAWYDFTQNPAIEKINNIILCLEHSHIKAFTTVVCLTGNSYLEVKEDELRDIRLGYYGIQEYSVVMDFMFDNREDNGTYYNLLSDMGENNVGGINLYLERMDDGFHICFQHSDLEEAQNRIVSNLIIRTKVWINVVVTFYMDTIKLYINGDLDTEKKQILPAYAIPEKRRCLIGADRDDTNDSQKDYFMGYITNCKMYNKALSIEEVNSCIWNQDVVEDSALGFSMEIEGDACFNGLTFCSIGMFNRAQIMEEMMSTLKNTNEYVCYRKSEVDPLSLDERLKIYELCKKQWISQLNENENSDSSIPYLVKAYKKEGVVYFVGCHNGMAYTIDYVEESLLTDEAIWWIELVLIILGGVCSALFGLYISSGKGIVTTISKTIFSNVKIVNSLKGMILSQISATMIIEFVCLLYKENVLKKLLKVLLVSLSVWSIISICLKIAGVAMGYGWGIIAAELCMVVVQIAAHIADYPNANHEDCVSQLTLTKVQYTNVLSAENTEYTQSIELRQDISSDFEDLYWSLDEKGKYSFAAYGMDAKKPIVMRAGFSYLEECSAKKIEVRASGGGVLGKSEVSTFYISMDKVGVEYVNIIFGNANIDRINKVETSITWEVNINGTGWNELTTTPVTIYCLLKTPQYQWDKSVMKPWIKALDYMIDAVKDCDSEEKLYQKVTESINGTKKLKYCSRSYYAGDKMNLTQYLEDLNSESEVNVNVNCADCGTLVTTFCNLFGGDLQDVCIAPLEPNLEDGFAYNSIRLIGETDSYQESYFSYHVVAVKYKGNMMLTRTAAVNQPIDTNNKQFLVYDACLRFKALETETEDVLPVGMPFSSYTDQYVKDCNGNVTRDSNYYRERLAKNGIDVMNCLLHIYCEKYAYRTIE